MEWLEYKVAFEAKAKENKKGNRYIKKWLSYAENLYNNNLPIIYTQKHLCDLLGYLPNYVFAASNSSENFYRYFKIPKKNGGVRLISEPLPNLKDIQEWILHNILYCVDVSAYAKAYIPKKTIKDNVRFHRRQNKVLTLDIKDFFGSLSDWMVFQFFLENGYSESVSMLLTKLCCLNGCLPQGAPTSSTLSNILMIDFDKEVAEYCLKNNIRYTRYADDMTFSGDFNAGEVINFIRKELNMMELELNDDKIRVRIQGQQQEVTGIVVNEKIQLPKRIRKEIRQHMYYISKFGLQSHLEYIGFENDNYLEQLLGKVGYAVFINPKDEEMERYKNILIDIKKKQNDIE